MPSAEEEGYEVIQEISLILSVSEERYEEFKKETKLDAERQADRTMVMMGGQILRSKFLSKQDPIGHFEMKLQ